MSATGILLPTEKPCTRCSTPGIVYWHTPEVCERDFARREQLTRIVTTEDAA